MPFLSPNPDTVKLRRTEDSTTDLLVYRIGTSYNISVCCGTRLRDKNIQSRQFNIVSVREQH